MMNVLICDDEIQIRKGLRMKVNWDNEGLTIVEEAANGKEALDKLRDNKIDIVITDVRMPVMDGIELAKKCHNDYPNVKVIVLSGYSDFEYAKSSMKAGVKDYLLKPVAPHELVQTLQRIRLEIEQEKKIELESKQMNLLVETQLEEMREQFLLYLVKDEFSELTITKERLQQLSLEDLVQRKNNVRFVTVEFRGTKQSESELKELFLPFKMLCKEYAEQHRNTYYFYDASYANMIHFICQESGKPLTYSSEFIKRLQKKVKEYLGVDTVIGIGESVIGYPHFKNGYISSLLSWSQSQVGSHSQVMAGVSEDEVFDFTLDIEKRMTNTIENANLPLFKALLKDILVDNQSMMSFSFKANRVLFLIGSLVRKYDLDSIEIKNRIWICQQSIWELNSQRKVIDQLNQLTQTMVEKVKEVRSSSSGSELVKKVRHFIEKHYANEITLSTLSKQFHINSAYLSEIFKTHVGKNFSDYLNDLRMENAKKLLMDPQLKIIDVAHLAGFSNSGYFSTVFKKNVGLSPAEYRKLYHSQ